jgi:carboxylesterase
MAPDILPGAEPFSRRGSSTGVLVLHGFTGSPESLRPLAERLAGAGYSVELPRLPGHGTSLEDMMTTSWEDWSTTALDAYDELTGRCERVAIVGLSMGGGLTAFVAEHRADVAACVFINALVKPPTLETLEGLDALLAAGIETIDAIGSDIKREGVTELSYPGTPLRCAKGMFEAMGPIHEGLGRIAVPSLVLSSREDHVVTSDNSDDLEARLAGPVERIWLEDSYHVATLDNDQEFLEHTTLSFLERVLAS